MPKNQLKQRALAIFENRGWISPPRWAVAAGFFPIRAVYTYLLRLNRFGLLYRRRSARGPVLYQLSPRGQHRLEWLRVGSMAIKKLTDGKHGTGLTAANRAALKGVLREVLEERGISKSPAPAPAKKKEMTLLERLTGRNKIF